MDVPPMTGGNCGVGNVASALGGTDMRRTQSTIRSGSCVNAAAGAVGVVSAVSATVCDATAVTGALGAAGTGSCTEGTITSVAAVITATPADRHE